MKDVCCPHLDHAALHQSVAREMSLFWSQHRQDTKLLVSQGIRISEHVLWDWGSVASAVSQSRLAIHESCLLRLYWRYIPAVHGRHVPFAQQDTSALHQIRLPDRMTCCQCESGRRRKCLRDVLANPGHFAGHKQLPGSISCLVSVSVRPKTHLLSLLVLF